MEICDILLLISFPAIIFGAFLGYMYGKRAGRKAMSLEAVNLPAMAVITEDDKHEKRNHIIQKYEMVTVLFADIVGFSEITDSLDPEELLFELNDFFLFFDKIIDSYQVEKIKTMGDAYMCAGGISHKNYTNPIDVVLMALDVQNHQKKMMEKNPNSWSIRIGIHTGPVIAGILGEKKLSFDIWGHTVNVASRLETSCERGNINVSGTTYEKIKKFFDCQYNGKVPHTVDDVASYIVNGLKPEFVQEENEGKMTTNHAFFVQMQLLRLIELEEYVSNLMKKNSAKLYFHNFEHIMDVYEHVELLAHLENVEDEDILLLKTAALMHDTGYATEYCSNVKEISENIARQSLPDFKYKPEQIDRVCELMNVAHYEAIPNGIVEEIMHDANHMYFERAGYNRLIMSLLRELQDNCMNIDKNEWLKSQSSRLVNHRYYTQSAIKLTKMFGEQKISSL